jgi:flavin-dependent dehydrogenase
VRFEITSDDNYDVAVIGGGPAGATTACFLAQSGRRVVLIDKAQHPRFHIGESFLPHNLPILDRLGVRQAVAGIGVHKPGAEFVSPEHEDRQTFFFEESLAPVLPSSYQVRRADFDEILFRRAEAVGVVLKEGCTVTQSRRLAQGWRLELDGDEVVSEISARYLVDASGRDGLIARAQDLRIRDSRHNSAALFAHYEGVSPDAWETQGNISIYWFEHGWIWMIPLPDGVTSIGAVCMPDYLKTRSDSLEEFMEETLRQCPKAWNVLKDATQIGDVSGAGNYSYKAKAAGGDGYLLVGDSYAFVDPVFSTGVLLAMSGAERAARTVNDILDRPARARAYQRRYQREIDRAIKRVSWFVVRFNTPTLRYLFMTPQNPFGVKNAVISVLAGDFYRGGVLAWRLRLFRAIFAVSRILNSGADKQLADRLRHLPSVSMPENEHSGEPAARSTARPTARPAIEPAIEPGRGV